LSSKLKILLVSNGFYPEISPRSFRATELAMEFSRQGHDVTVITRFRNHDYKNFLSESPICLRMWSKYRLKEVPNIGGRWTRLLARIINRVLKVLFEYPTIEDMFKLKKILKHENGYNLLISFAVPYPVHWGVAWSRTRKHKIAGKWIADCGDPYMGDILDTFRKPFYFKYIEMWFSRKADFLTIPIEGAIDGYYPEFHRKIRIIPQGFNFDIETRTKKIPENKIPTFAYAGGFIPGARDPRPFLKYLMSVTTPFRFYIYTNQPELLEPFKKTLDGNLIILPYINRSDLLDILSGMDFLINFDNNTSLNSPSKLIDYAITGRPVLNITREFDFAELGHFLNGNYTNSMILPDPRVYHIESVARQFISLL
jgi:hypothetical protein